MTNSEVILDITMSLDDFIAGPNDMANLFIIGSLVEIFQVNTTIFLRSLKRVLSFSTKRSSR